MGTWDSVNVDIEKYPQFVDYILMKATIKSCFVRGSTVRYVHVSPTDVDTEVIEETFRRARQTN